MDIIGFVVMFVYLIKLKILIVFFLLCLNLLVIIVEYKGGMIFIEILNSVSVRVMRMREMECVMVNNMIL